MAELTFIQGTHWYIACIWVLTTSNTKNNKFMMDEHEKNTFIDVCVAINP